jgi:peptidyl-tRNA hydrolase, PTH2 family
MIKQVIVMRTTYPCEGGVKKLRRGKEIAQACHASIAFLTNKIQSLNNDFSMSNWISSSIYADDPAEAYIEGFNAAKELLKMSPVELDWINGIFTKICLKVDTEEQLLEVKRKADEKGLQCHLITDRGLTEFGGVPTNTCLSIGPDESYKIDEVTGGLELY